MREIKGFRVIDAPTSLAGFVVHSFFIKEHSDNKVMKGCGKTLFVGNVDYVHSRTHGEVDGMLKDFFGIFGDIESISISEFKDDIDHPSSSILREKSRFAHVVFAKKSSLNSSLSANDTLYSEASLELARKWGVQGDRIVSKVTRSQLFSAFKNSYEDVKDVKLEVDSFMKDFEENEEIAKIEREKRLKMADADGFMPVKNRFDFGTFFVDVLFFVLTPERSTREWKKSEVLVNLVREQKRKVKTSRISTDFKCVKTEKTSSKT